MSVPVGQVDWLKSTPRRKLKTYLFGPELESQLPANDVGLVEAEPVVTNSAPATVQLNLDEISLASRNQTNG